MYFASKPSYGRANHRQHVMQWLSFRIPLSTLGVQLTLRSNCKFLLTKI